MVRKLRVIRNEYYDSWYLMKVSRDLLREEDVADIGILMGTERNKGFLSNNGMLDDNGKNAGENDLIIVVECSTEEQADQVLALAEKRLRNPVKTVTERDVYPTLSTAIEQNSDANLVFISTPGAYAGEIASQALARGLHVFLFSDNVDIATEVSLKKEAEKYGLLMMGPGCGTAYINGTGIGFANRIRRGPVGIIGAAGTGIQELSVHLHRAGLGVSHAIGTGGRDLSKEVGGITTKVGLDILEQDSSTDIIIILSKPSNGDFPSRVMKRVGGCKKPVYFVLLGLNEENLRKAFGDGAYVFPTIESVLRPVLYALGKGTAYLEYCEVKEEEAKARAIKRTIEWDARGLVIRGGFCGGSLTAESLCVLQQMSISAESNIRMAGVKALSGSPNMHRIIDFGAEEYTKERAHPMTDPTLRNNWLRDESEKVKSTVVLLFDIMLGFGSHSDPAGSIVSDLYTIIAEKRVLSVTSVCGVTEDIQNADAQTRLLESQGVIVAPSNAAAARISAFLVSKSSGEIM